MIKKQVKERIKDILFYIVLISILILMFSLKSIRSGAPVSVFGVSLHTVLTSSMEDEIPKGSFVVTYHVDPGTLNIGDDITFMRDEDTSVTHRIIGITENYANTGQRGFETQGVNNSQPDKDIVAAVNVVGKVVYHNYIIGIVIQFINQYWYFVIPLFVLGYALIKSLKNLFFDN